MTSHLIVVSDLHINSTVALCAPGVELDDGGTYHLNRSQRWLYACWREFCEEVGRLQGRKIVCFNGDLGELDTKRRSVQLITANKATIVKMVQRTIEPLVELADSLIVVRGTPAHEGKGAWLEELIANDYDHTIRHDGTASWYHLRTVIDGVRYDIAHHASMTANPWGRGNSANNLAHKICFAYAVQMGQPVPHIAHRAHNHIIAESSGFPCHVQYGPAWSIATEYSYRAGYENNLSDIGGIIWTHDGGSYERKIVRFNPTASRRIWSMTI